MNGPVDHQRLHMYHVAPANYGLIPPHSGQYQQPKYGGIYLHPSHPWSLPASHGTTYGNAYPQRGHLATSPQYFKAHWGLPPAPPYGFPPVLPENPVNFRSGPWEKKQPDLEPMLNSPLPLGARGPPLKPRQSGWAVWVGNLPQDTTVIHLRDYFSCGAREDIESVFLIKKTNCAFVNYSTAKACLAAMQRFDNNVFRGHRIVCRIRRGSSSNERSSTTADPSKSDVPSLSDGSSSPSVPDASSGSDNDTPLIVRGDDMAHRDADAKHVRTDAHDVTESSLAAMEKLSIKPRVKTRMFILKSLTVQDLLVSTRDGAWVTQPHNEDKLNEAFHSAEDVYLIFSANKSGQYFGYARMESAIPKRETSVANVTVPSPTRQQFGHDSFVENAPQVISTPATANAPEGYIIDDSARGTIFWEVGPIDDKGSLTSSDNESGASKGSQFAIRWITTTQIPFHATRGLRNPLNNNREVKIARDGTELDAHAGARLLQLFHRGSNPTSPTSRWD